jgi:hypothetical protein
MGGKPSDALPAVSVPVVTQFDSPVVGFFAAGGGDGARATVATGVCLESGRAASKLFAETTGGKSFCGRRDSPMGLGIAKAGAADGEVA